VKKTPKQPKIKPSFYGIHEIEIHTNDIGTGKSKT